jgi:hypothetical protein
LATSETPSVAKRGFAIGAGELILGHALVRGGDELHYDRIVLDLFAPTSGRTPLLVLPRGGPPRSLDVLDARGLVDLLVAGVDIVALHAGLRCARSARSR